MICQPALGGDASLSAIFVARHEGQANKGSQGRGSCDDVDGVHVFYFLFDEEARLLFHHASKLGLTISHPPRLPLGIQAANSPRCAKRRIM